MVASKQVGQGQLGVASPASTHYKHQTMARQRHGITHQRHANGADAMTPLQIHVKETPRSAVLDMLERKGRGVCFHNICWRTSLL